MTYSAYLLYVLLFVIVLAMWRRVRGRSLTDLFDASAREHHRVQRVAAKHPRGGTWKEMRIWLREEQEHPE